jgi:LEA14-like dessication related protein
MVSLPLAHEGTFAIPKVPEAHFGSPRISGLTFAGGTVELTIVFGNRNRFPLPLGRLTGTVTMAGARVAEVRTEPVGVLPPSGQRAITIPVHVDSAKHYAAGRALQVGEASVSFSGTFESGPATLPIELQEKVRF